MRCWYYKTHCHVWKTKNIFQWRVVIFPLKYMHFEYEISVPHTTTTLYERRQTCKNLARVSHELVQCLCTPSVQKYKAISFWDKLWLAIYSIKYDLHVIQKYMIRWIFQRISRWHTFRWLSTYIFLTNLLIKVWHEKRSGLVFMKGESINVYSFH
jgi:hypothetical protein